MSAPQGPVWKGDRCISRYLWENAPLPSRSPPISPGQQAVQISLMRKRGPKKGTGKELYVCKWFKTSGVKQAGLGGPKFIHREWMILSSVHHPNIVSYADFSYDPNGASLAKLYLEYCPGGDLSRHLKRSSRDDRLSFREGLQVLEQLAQALMYIHHGILEEGKPTKLASPIHDSLHPNAKDERTMWTTILHRDIKPANVFIVEHNKDGIVVKLGDFGIATFQTDGTDTYVGSKKFMAPEQRHSNYEGRQTITKSDVYALGVTIKQVTKRDAISNEDPLQQQLPHNNAWSRLLRRLTRQNDFERPGSGAIIDTIRMSLYTRQESATMLSKVVSRVLDWGAKGLTTSGRKKAKVDLASQLLLCRRLMFACTAGHGADNTYHDMKANLERAVAFINMNLEALEVPNDLGAPCPGWKGSIVEELISIFRHYGAMYALPTRDGDRSAVPYYLGPHTYQSLHASSNTERRKMLLDVIKPKYTWIEKVPDLTFLDDLPWAELLPFTSHYDLPSSFSRETKLAMLPHKRWPEFKRFPSLNYEGGGRRGLPINNWPVSHYRSPGLDTTPSELGYATLYDSHSYYDSFLQREI